MIKALGPLAAVAGLVFLGGSLAGLAQAAPASQAAAAAPGDAEVADAPELDESSYTDLVKDAQRLLTLRGFDPGPLDGQLGLRTRRAIRAYQAEARARGVLEALKGPAGQSPVDPVGRPELVRIDSSDAPSD